MAVDLSAHLNPDLGPDGCREERTWECHPFEAVALYLEVLAQTLGLRRLAGSVESFDNNESTTCARCHLRK